MGGDGKGILRALFILQLEILEEERLGRKWKSMFPGLKADQCGLTAVSNQGERRASSSREALQTTHRTILRSPGAFEFCVERGL